MDYVLNILRELRDCAISELKQGKNESLKTKLDLDRAISCVEFCNKHNLFTNKKEKYTIFELPFLCTGYSDYRIIDDCETDHREYWKELKLIKDDEIVYLSPGDIIIQRK